MMKHRRLVGPLVVAVLTAVLPACGGGGGSSTSPTPTGPTQAKITVTAGAPVVTFSPRAGFTFRVTVAVTITESAGLGANINFIRLRFIAGGVEIERQEISSADIILISGSNRLNASSTRSFNAIFDTNAEAATSGILVFNFTDDRGNNLESTFTITF